MESKSRYNSRAVQEQIRKQTQNSKDTSVIYFVDTDDWDVSAVDNKLLEQIKAYCEKNGYYDAISQIERSGFFSFWGNNEIKENRKSYTFVHLCILA